MSAQPTEMLFVSAGGQQVLAALDPAAYRVSVVDEPGKAMQALHDAGYELILLDDALFSSDILSVVKEIKRRFPLVPALVLSESIDTAYQTDVMEAGADDLLSYGLPGEELQRRLRLILRQRRQARALAQRNQNLQSITLLARRMHSATEPYALIEDTVDTACSTFRLYGMAIVLGDGENFQLYAGRERGASKGGLSESSLQLKDYDPFRRVIRSGMVQVFRNIVADPHYVPIAALPSPESAIILPLNYQEHHFGAMAIFGTGSQPLSHDDLLIYELFASQFTVALHNARHYHSQRISAQSSQHLLRAWPRFINLHTYDEVSEVLRELLEEIPNVPQALVWMYDPDPANTVTVVKTGREDAARAFRQLEQEGQITALLNQLGEQGMQPLLLQPEAGQKGVLGAFFKSMKAQQLILVGIMDSARLIGGILASVVNNRQYSSDDARLLAAGLAQAAGLAVERTTLIQEMAEKSGRLEALLRSTSQGIFFVDHTGQVAFCNPQFTELTGLNPSAVLSQPSSTVLSLIAEQTSSPEPLLAQLHDAVGRVLSPDPELHEDYPIVELSIRDLARDILVEFTLIGDPDGEHSGWAGIVRDNSRYKRAFASQSVLLDVMSERIRVPYAQVRGMVTTLTEQHSRFSHRERGRFLYEIEDSIKRLGHLWDNFLEMYTLEVSGLALSREAVDLYEVIQRLLESRAFSEYRRQIQLDAPASLPMIEVDEQRVEQALANVLDNALRFSPKGGAVQFTLVQEEETIRISVSDQGIGIPREQLAKVFEPFAEVSNQVGEEGAGLGLYLAREIVRRHGGQLWIESEPSKGTTVGITLPIVATGEIRMVAAPVSLPEPAAPPMARVESPMPVERGGGGRRVSERPMQTIMLVEGRSTLMARLKEKMGNQGYELIPYRSAEEAVRDVNSIRLDLIFLDVSLNDANGLDICERMCKRTEVPIIMLADEPSEAEKVRALMIGADDYISQPISDDELMARVHVIFKRRRIPDRTREPLDLGNLYVDFARREVFLANKPLELTRIEYDLLHTLAVNQGQVLTHKQLLEKVWGPEYQAETQYLWVNVSRLRKKLEPTPDSPRYIHTQPGVGYVFRPS